MAKQYSLVNSFFMRRLTVFCIIALSFTVGFIWNAAFFSSVFNYSAQIVAQWQTDPDLMSPSFLNFMDFVSDYLFSTQFFQYYVMLFLIISYRKFQIGVFLIWLSFVYFMLENFKNVFHQPRPYQTDDGVQMLANNCNQSYGMPSGHATLSIVFLDFVVRFYIRQYNFVLKTSYIWYIMAICLQILVCYSRIILGMHSLNQVLFGFMIGIFCCVMYVYFFETLLMSWCLVILCPRHKKISLVIITACFLFTIFLDYLIAFVPKYDNLNYTINLNKIPACGHVHEFKSFQYSAFKNTGYTTAAFGTLYAFLIIPRPQHLMLKPQYRFFSLSSLTKILIGLITAGLPMWLFHTNIWQNLQNFDNAWLAIMKWALLSLGCFFGPFCYFLILPIIAEWMNIQKYQYPKSYDQFKQDQTFSLEIQTFKQMQKQLQLPGYSRYHDQQQAK